MRVRKLSPSGDFTFGQSALNYWKDVPQAVGQVVQTTLELWLGEFFLNLNAGTPYPEGVLGFKSQAEADLTITSTIINVQGMVGIQNFESTFDPITRKYQVVEGDLNTIYGQTQLQKQNVGNF